MMKLSGIKLMSRLVGLVKPLSGYMLPDEPTSNLDSLNEAVILRAFHEERRGRTVVLVSHHNSTMDIFDSVYSVESGRMS